jgi:exonuclease III
MKIATWNVCLGLTSKKDEIQRMLINEDIDICLIQEAEIPMNFPIKDLTIRSYSIEVETNKSKLRTYTYIKRASAQKGEKILN